MRSPASLRRSATALTLLFATAMAAYLVSGCGKKEAERSASPTAGKTATGEQKILFYRNPMNPTVTSPVPKKDEMGMDYVPVFAGEGRPEVLLPGQATVTLPAAQQRLAGIETAPVVRETLRRSIRTVGLVNPDERRIRHVHTKVSGWVEKLYVNYTGQAVRAGEPILSLYSPELLASQEELLRAREANASFGASTIPEVRKGGADLVTSARRRLELFDLPTSLIERLERGGEAQRTVTLRAPVSGFVTTKDVFDGQRIDPGMELYTITDLSTVWIEADFYEYEAGALRVGQRVTVVLPYDRRVELAGRVELIYPTLATDTRTLKVRFSVPNRGGALKPGMFVDVLAEIEASDGLVVPESAVIDTGVRQVVFVERSPGTFEPRDVRVGVRGDGKALILEGVAAGERVAARANFLLDSESQLRAAVAGTAPALPAAPPVHQHKGDKP